MSSTSDEVPPQKQDKAMVDSEHFLTEEEETPVGCGILGRYPVLSVMGFAAIGIGIGVGLSYWEPDDMDAKDKTLKWIGLVGDLFIRSLKCVVLPLVRVWHPISKPTMLRSSSEFQAHASYN